MKISEIFFSFFSTLNQYFPHIPYVASKKHMKHKFQLLSFQFAENNFYFPHIKYEKYWFHLQILFFIANFHVLGHFIPKKSDALVGRV
jgi:hypothetical protein